MASSGLQCEVSVIHFKWIKGGSEWIYIKVCWNLWVIWWIW